MRKSSVGHPVYESEYCFLLIAERVCYKQDITDVNKNRATDDDHDSGGEQKIAIIAAATAAAQGRIKIGAKRASAPGRYIYKVDT